MGLFHHLEDKIKKSKFNYTNEKVDNNPVNSNQYGTTLDQNSMAPPPIPARDYMKSSNSSPEYSTISTPISKQANFNSTPSNIYHNTTNFFDKPISLNPPPSQISASNVHPVPLPKFYGQQGPVETNNFYGNLLVEDQNLPVWTHPYSVWKSTDDQFKGLGISHTESSQKVFGDDPNLNPVKYFFNPVGICSLMLSAEEFQAQNFDFTVGDCQRFSIGTKFSIKQGEMHVDLVQGMGFITALYTGFITPRIASKVGIQDLQQLGTLSNGLSKYLVTLFDNHKWLIYTNAQLQKQTSNSLISTNSNNSQVIVQIAKISNDDNVQYYDEVAGSYVTGLELTGASKEDECSYTFNYLIKGQSKSNKVLQWLLPHHVESMDPKMKQQIANNLTLDSTCKGPMLAFILDKFTMNEKLPPKELQYDPWSDIRGVCGYPDSAKSIIGQVAQSEVNSFDVVNESNTDSMYTAGKILDKGAFILYVVAFVLNDKNLSLIMLEKMKTAFARFINNTQQAPLCYNNTWKGVVSTSGLSDGNFYCDFGNCFYNDHHFHYGYHIHAASLVALADKKYGDGNWVQFAKDWIETLIRDVCNPSAKDPYFPVFRSFDFFNGHSFANGLFAHGDGKDEESSSEDYHAYYGIKLWAQITQNHELETLASLILSIEKRAMGMYMLFKNSNKVMPQNFIRNKVSGILFENKIDHATYFGMNKEYIHGIHMIPITPISNYIRSTEFATEEWNEMALGQLANSIDGGWKGLLMLNSAIVDASQAFQFFSAQNFQMSWLDNGMSRTWSLAYCAGMSSH